MADISDVEQCLVTIISGALQLGSHYLPGSAVVSPVAKAKCEVFRGWPVASHLTPSIESGTSTISVFPVAGGTRRTTRYFPEWHALPSTPTLTASVSGSMVTLGGSPSPTQVIALRYGGSAAAQAFAYRPGANDTIPTIAVALAGMIQGATSSGATVNLPANINVSATVVADEQAWMETRRQEQNIWVIGWCPSPGIRDAVMSAVDAGFANMMTPQGDLTDQFPLPDGSSARLQYISSHTDDMAQRAGIWRRDLRYVVSYPTTMTQIQTPATSIGGSVEVNGDAAFVFGDIQPT